MLILLFDIDASSISCRCHQYYLRLLFVYMLLINCCGYVETTSLKIDASTPKTDPIILPTPVKQQQPKPSSVIYIPSLDGKNSIIIYLFIFMCVCVRACILFIFFKHQNDQMGIIIFLVNTLITPIYHNTIYQS